MVLTSCLDFSGGCAEDFVEGRRKVYVTDLNGRFQSVENEWRIGTYLSQSITIYGLDESSNIFYYSDVYRLDPLKLFKVDLQTGIRSKIEFDLNGQNYVFSPNAKYLAYKKIVEEKYSTIALYSIEDSTENSIQTDSLTGPRQMPKWASNTEVAYNKYSLEGNGIGIFKTNIDDNATFQLTSMTPRWGSDIHEDQKSVVFSAETQSPTTGFSEASIFYSRQYDSLPKLIALGTYPYFIPKKNKIIYQNGNEIRLFDIDTEEDINVFTAQRADLLYKNIAIANSGSFIILADITGVIKIDTETLQESYLVKSSDLFNEFDVTKWDSPYFYFNAPIISSDDSKVYFILNIEVSENVMINWSSKHSSV